MPPELEPLFAQAERHLRWFNEHAEALGVFHHYRGCYVAAAGEELFVGDSYEAAERAARAKHPDELPHIRYIPREKADRIYAYQRPMGAM